MDIESQYIKKKLNWYRSQLDIAKAVIRQLVYGICPNGPAYIHPFDAYHLIQEQLTLQQSYFVSKDINGLDKLIINGKEYIQTTFIPAKNKDLS